jgi:hypothetical protein
MRKIWVAAGIVGAFGMGATGVAFAFSNFNAKQSGYHQYGSAQASTLKIKVEAGLPAGDEVLIPDSPYCPALVNDCGGGALSFSITNPTDVPLQVTNLAVATVPCFIQGCTPSPQIGSSNFNCGPHISFVAPPLNNNGFTDPTKPMPLSSWPVIAPHSTLNVNGSDYGGLGSRMVHLDYNTPDECQGASISVGLVVTARDAA